MITINNEFDDEEGDESFNLPGGFDPVKFDTSSRRIRDLFADYNDGILNPNPNFQRGYVWDKQTASRLIESVLLNVPLPLVYTAETDDEEEVVIDGQQRLRTFFGFMSNRFPGNDKKFALSGLKIKTELNNKTFEELDKNIKSALRKYNIQIIKISHDSDPEVKFEIFERLNSGAVKLNAQELRNCVYRGSTNDVINELSENEKFSKLIGVSQKSRMKDAELVLRYISFLRKTYLNYNGGMKNFLNNYMIEDREINQKTKDEISQKFKDAVDLAFSVFGDHAFRRFSKGHIDNPNGEWERTLNRAVYDIVMWSFSIFPKHIIMSNLDEIRESFIRLNVDDELFLDAILQGTGDKLRVTRRFEIWKAELDKIIQNQTSSRTFKFSIKQNLFNSNNICGICRQQINHLDDAEVDHIIPYSKGGQTVIENAQISHRYCNRRKSDS